MSKETPRTLYVSRPVVNTDDIIEWAKSQGLKSMLSSDELHVTICYSKEKFVWGDLKPSKEKLTVAAIKPDDKDPPVRQMEMFGKEKNVLVLQIESDELHKRWQEFCDEGASYDFPEYKPHITITYNGNDVDVDIDKIEPYQGKIVFGPEKFKKIEKQWAGDADEIDLTESILAEAVAVKEHDYVILSNPSAQQITVLQSKCRHEEGLRGLLDEGTLYVWDGFYATHGEAARLLGLPRTHEDVLYCLHIRRDEVEMEVSDVGMSNDPDTEFYDDDIIWFHKARANIEAGMAAVENNPALRRYYNGYVHIVFDDPQQWEDLKDFTSRHPFDRAITEARTEMANGIRVHVNPTAGQLAQMCDREDLRGICDGENVYVWPSYAGVHLHIMNALGIDSRYYDQRFYAFLPNFGENKRDWDDRTDLGNAYETLRSGVVIGARSHSFASLQKNPTIARWFSPARPMESKEQTLKTRLLEAEDKLNRIACKLERIRVSRS